MIQLLVKKFKCPSKSGIAWHLQNETTYIKIVTTCRETGTRRLGRIVLHVMMSVSVRLMKADGRNSPRYSVFMKMAFVQMVLSTSSPKTSEFLSCYCYD